MRTLALKIKGVQHVLFLETLFAPHEWHDVRLNRTRLRAYFQGLRVFNFAQGAMV